MRDRKVSSKVFSEFEIVEDPKTDILKWFRKNKIGYCHLISKKIGVSNYCVRENIDKLVSEGIIKDLGLKTIRVKNSSKKARVYELV